MRGTILEGIDVVILRHAELAAQAVGDSHTAPFTMTIRSIAFLVLVALVIAAIYQLVYYYPLLPDRVASHFGAGGEADGWSDKKSFTMLIGAVLALLVGTFLGIVILLEKFPLMINLPHRDYWLTSPQREQTMAALSSRLLWMGNVTLAFLLFTVQRSIDANLNPPANLGAGFVVALVIYFMVILGLTIEMVVRFRRPGES